MQPFAAESAAAAVMARLERPAILVLDEEASIRFWNRGAEVLYGWTSEEALGRRLTWLMGEGAAEAALVLAELAAVRITGSGERIERRRRADGSTVSVSVGKVADPSGCVWEVSEPAVTVLPDSQAPFGGVEALLGAGVLVFGAEGTLTECSPPELRTDLPGGEIERARSLALRAFRVGHACEQPGTAGSLWLRAVLVAHQGRATAVVLIRSAIGDGVSVETESRRLADLCRQLFDTQEAERRRLARELHDDLGQSLTGLLYALESERAPREHLRGEAAALLAKVRRLSQGLRPGILDDLGLSAALRWLADEYGGRAGTEVTLEMKDGDWRWPSELETAMFRIAQEALTNAARHAAAERIVIKVAAQNGELEMSIEDDGSGFDPSSVLDRSTGLASMRERALLLGGRFDLESEVGRGTRIRVGLPLLRGAAG